MLAFRSSNFCYMHVSIRTIDQWRAFASVVLVSTGKFDFTHMTINDITVYANWMRVFGKKLRCGLETDTKTLHSRFGPILMNTDRVL